MEQPELEDLKYNIGLELLEFLENVYQSDTIKIVSIFNSLAELNEHYINHDKFYLDKLEQRCLDIIATSTSNEDGKLNMEIYIKRALDHYLSVYGIELHTEDTDIYSYSDIMQALVYLYQVDIPTATEYLPIVEADDIDNIERFTDLLSEYTIMGKSYLYDIVKDVSDDWFEHTRLFYKSMIHRGIEDVNTDDIAKVQPLVDISPKFMSTYAVRDTLYYGYIEYHLDSMLDELYTRLNVHGDDYDLIAMEIVAANYLSTDRPIQDETTLLDTINFKSLAIDYADSLRFVVPNVLEYMNLIKG